MSDVILTPGGQARIYKHGVLVAAVLVPHGRMEVRELAPGDYLARDEDGNAVEFIVSPFSEVAVVQIPEDADAGPVASAETPHDVDMETGEPVTGPPEPDSETGPFYPDEHPPLSRRTDERDDEVRGVIVAEQEGHADPVPNWVADELDELTVADLRRRAKDAGVVQKGSKEELRARIRAALEPVDGDVDNTGEATADEPSAEEQLEGQDGPPEATEVPADPAFKEGSDVVKDQHHLEHAEDEAARDPDAMAAERKATQRKMGV